MIFKNALCLASIPEALYSGLSIRHRCCQRKGDHLGPHRTYSRTWSDGDNESIARSAEPDPRRRSYERFNTLILTEPQKFWLTILLESTLAAADPSRATASYAAVLRKLKQGHAAD